MQILRIHAVDCRSIEAMEGVTESDKFLAMSSYIEATFDKEEARTLTTQTWKRYIRKMNKYFQSSLGRKRNRGRKPRSRLVRSQARMRIDRMEANRLHEEAMAPLTWHENHDAMGVARTHDVYQMVKYRRSLKAA